MNQTALAAPLTARNLHLGLLWKSFDKEQGDGAAGIGMRNDGVG